MAVVVDADRVEVEVVDVAVPGDGGLEGFLEVDVIEAVPLEEHAADGMSSSWMIPSTSRPSTGPPIRDRSVWISL